MTSERETGSPPSPIAAHATGIGVAVIWVATVVASILSPDLITGSQQEHLPLAALVDWIWAAVATGYVAMAGASSPAAQPHATGFLISLIAVWGAIALVSILAPPLVTGTDPTQVPLPAIIAPLAALAATGFVCLRSAARR